MRKASVSGKDCVINKNTQQQAAAAAYSLFKDLLSCGLFICYQCSCIGVLDAALRTTSRTTFSDIEGKVSIEVHHSINQGAHLKVKLRA